MHAAPRMLGTQTVASQQQTGATLSAEQEHLLCTSVLEGSEGSRADAMVARVLHQGSVSCFQMCVVVIWCLLVWNSCGESWNLPQSCHVQQFIQTKLDQNFLRS